MQEIFSVVKIIFKWKWKILSWFGVAKHKLSYESSARSPTRHLCKTKFLKCHSGLHTFVKKLCNSFYLFTSLLTYWKANVEKIEENYLVYLTKSFSPYEFWPTVQNSGDDVVHTENQTKKIPSFQNGIYISVHKSSN